MKTIINTPLVSIPAGVSNHYLGLKPFFSRDIIYNQYMPGGYIRCKVRFNAIYKPLRILLMFFDIVKFLCFIIVYGCPTVLLNPSFGKNALKRDAFFLKIAKLFNCKVAVFIHGWDKSYLEKVFNQEEPFNPIWYDADTFLVLANEFKSYLQQLKIQVPIHLTTTKVNDKLVDGIYQKEISSITKVLFLARIEEAKGIYTTIDSFEILIKKHPEMKLRIVGDGNTLEKVIEYVQSKQINNIYFTGSLSGSQLQKEFLMADLYILPTHGEGMPTSVLEAMAFGLPVITRPVGGLVDFFENGKMGYLIESLDPQDYAEKIELLISDIDKANMISSYNMRYAKEHFMASEVAKQLENILIGLK